MRGDGYMNKKDLFFTVGCLLIVAAIMIVGVYVVGENVSTVENQKDEVVVKNEVIENNVVEVKPFNFGSSINNIEDLEVSAEFTTADIDSENKNIKFSIYNPDLYDSMEIKELKVGDKIIVNEKTIDIETIEFTDYLVEINGGFDGRENGVSLSHEDKDTYKSVIFNDLSTFAFVGEVELPISNELVIYDYMHGDYGDEPTVIEYDKIEDYFNGLSDILKEFGRTSTLVKVKNNEVVSITRVWRP